MTRSQALVAAAGLTALVLIAVLLWGYRTADATGSTEATAAQPDAGLQLVIPATTNATGSQQLMEENRQLRQAVELLMARDAEYQRQIEAANQRLQAAAASQAVDEGVSYEDDDHERYEH